MNVEKTMEFILKQQAKFEANFEASFQRSNQRLDRVERVLAQTNRVVAKLASTGVALRSDLRRHEKAIAKHEEYAARHDVMMAEMEGKLNALIDFVDKQTRRNGAK
ncbi:MAG TPA: hypothetical protein VGX94_17810 [Terriglobia bacterium]|nr:hypothetical protein [Terriglobia bacterium]